MRHATRALAVLFIVAAIAAPRAAAKRPITEQDLL